MRDKKSIQNYWEGRAQQQASSPAATTNDVYMRNLEIRTLIETCRELNLQGGQALDLGCGDGYSTVAVAEGIDGFSFLGVDYSVGMINSAQERLNEVPALQNRVRFMVGDATKIGEVCAGQKFHLVISDRVLINLETVDRQYSTMAEIGELLREGGYYLAIENFVEGQKVLNETRRSMGLSEIPVRWHNLFFRQDEFIEHAKKWFDVLELKDFSSSYYFATRVIYSRMCQMLGEEPDYHHPIHQLAGELPCIGSFSPIKLAILRKKPVTRR